MDFFELETSGGGTWRSGEVIDCATKLALAGPVTATQTTRDAIASVRAAIEEAERLIGAPLIEDLIDPHTGEIRTIVLVSDNGPCFKSGAFARIIASRPGLTHVRTRKNSPQDNGVIDRYLADPHPTAIATLPTRQTERTSLTRDTCVTRYQ